MSDKPETIQWKRIDAYHMRNGDWTIAKCFVDGATLYVLWHRKESKGHFECAEDAIGAYEAIDR